MDKLTIKAYGKLNLYLDITGKRDDGYHLLRSVMQSVSVYDTLTFSFEDGEGIELRCGTIGFPTDSSNLIVKALYAFHKHCGIKQKGRLIVDVDKRIPSMAGMAGGSADCAAALAAVNELNGSPLSLEELCSIGVRLGADVPFTLVGGTVLCEGIGEKLTKLPALEDIWFAAVQPEVRISTPEAYKAYDSAPVSSKKSYAYFEDAVRNKDINGVADGLFNALEAAADVPQITEAKEKMLSRGALGSLMTGSGSVVFGVFRSETDARRCIEDLSEYRFREVLATVGRGWEIVR